MTNLKQILTSVLHDVVQAQHEANLFAVNLAAEYAQQNKGLTITPPSVAVGELSINLRYAVQEGEEINEKKTLNQKEKANWLKKLSKQLAKLMIRKLVEELQASKVPYEDNGFSFVNDLGDNESLQDYIAQRTLTSLELLKDRIILENSAFDIELISDQVLYVGEQYLLKHSDIIGLFNLPEGSALFNRIKKVLDHEINDSVKQIVDEISVETMFDSHSYASLNITVNADELKKLPAESIQQLSIKIGSKTINEVTNL